MLGRPGNNLKLGIVGLPNVGKSSLFNILSSLNVPAENFPFWYVLVCLGAARRFS